MTTLEKYVGMVNNQLDIYLCETEKHYQRVTDAMKYSVQAGGKRIRAALALGFCRACGETEETALSAACAIEMMHTFSLIHDDLPCMDDDDYRRGKESCHKKFGEATALLAGDALAVLPFQIIAGAAAEGKIPCDRAVSIIELLADCTGKNGMIGGQQMDVEGAVKNDSKLIGEMYMLKTSCLLKAACCSGCIAAGADKAQVGYAAEYAGRLGYAFQIVDDILDVEGNEKILGKPSGSDEKSGKITYVTLYGIDRAKQKAAELTNEALEYLSYFDNDEFITGLTKMLLIRNK